MHIYSILSLKVDSKSKWNNKFYFEHPPFYHAKDALSKDKHTNNYTVYMSNLSNCAV